MARDCVCGRSSKFPYCDGTHTRLNRISLKELETPTQPAAKDIMLDDEQ